MDRDIVWIVDEKTEEVDALETIKGSRGSEWPDAVGGGLGASVKKSKLIKRRVPIDVVSLKAQMNNLLSVVSDIFDQAGQHSGMSLSEVELTVEINAQGQVSIVGDTRGQDTRGAITLKFTRSSQ
jgi:hypothetical protein